MAYAIFDTPAIHGIPASKELAQAGGEMVPPLMIAPAQLLHQDTEIFSGFNQPVMAKELPPATARRGPARGCATGSDDTAEA